MNVTPQGHPKPLTTQNPFKKETSMEKAHPRSQIATHSPPKAMTTLSNPTSHFPARSETAAPRTVHCAKDRYAISKEPKEFSSPTRLRSAARSPVVEEGDQVWPFTVWWRLWMRTSWNWSFGRWHSVLCWGRGGTIDMCCVACVY